ncbi:bifunctional hydroxymethylpyrimidine kinase/phosphomethylpyrimidine kinase [Microbaculum sp. FT89]|uniref:bifunctional hydroxymethylpyrimidine kinase/phosphomethylpyrimidine kinase n=1 Tax=Microbaculum sp. FT89 TaxID=3447298 RepID=UPI003F53CB41
MATLLSISSWVARGHVGNAAIRFPLMRRGIDVVALPTVILAHHPGHARDVARAEMPDILAMGQDILGSPSPHPVDGVLAGYVALAPQAVAIAGLVAEARAYREGVPMLLDPIVGDNGQLYVDPLVVDEIRANLVPMADIATPNVTELVALTAPKRIRKAPSLDEAEIVKLARKLPVPTVVVTSAPASGEGRSANIVVTEDIAVRIETPTVELHVHGTGDLLAGLVLGEIVGGQDIVPAVAMASAIVHDVLAVTARAGRDELAVVAAQKLIASPKTTAEVAML